MKDSIILEQYFDIHMDEFISILRELVELETPSHESKEASDKCSRYLQALLRSLGCKVTVIPQTTCGDHIYAELGSGPKGCLLVGHYDTVFPLGSLEEIPFRVEENLAYGPGILDMKGGLLLSIFAVRALQQNHILPKKKIGFFFNGDEESGSFSSSNLIVTTAKEYSCVLVAEPGLDEINVIKNGRYGRGTYKITAHGKSAHSGTNPDQALNPMLELAHQLLYIDTLNDYEHGLTLAPTCMSAGIYGTCRIPETGWISVDVRAKTAEMMKEIDQQMAELKAVIPGVSLEISGGIDKPPMEGAPSLVEQAERLGAELGMQIQAVTVGGGSDGNFTSGAGIPTLDGLGMSGLLLHTPHEYIHLDHIPKRGALLARLIQTL